MSQQFLTFLCFNQLNDAKNAIHFLQENGIETELENERNYFDISYANNKYNADIKVKIKSEDFEKANTIVEAYYEKQIDSTSSDYFMFNFSDKELFNVVHYKDDWGHFNYVLAKDILKKRNVEIDEKQIKDSHNKILNIKAKPKSASSLVLLLGYLGGFGSFVFPHLATFSLPLTTGCLLAFMTRTLSNGNNVPYFDKPSKQNGYVMIVLFVLSIIWWCAGGWLKYFCN